jgi:hypothetical protein
MASTIKVNNIQNQCGANIANKCGSTITLGASGDTITLACGASQTGFGRTGTVDWDTTAKTASFTAVSGNGYFVNTTSGAITVTLPATPSAGDIVAVADYAGTSNTNNITIGRNSSNINGSASDIIISINGKSITLVYVDGTQGWKITDNADQTTEGPSYITATGGTITTCGDYKIHTFTGPGTFCVSGVSSTPTDNTIDYLVVAGGAAGGGTAIFGSTNGAGGGAGGVRFFADLTNNPQGGPAAPRNAPAGITITATSYPITVGAGGAASGNSGNPGNNSIFSSITSTGGGGGGSANSPISPTEYGRPGGSGGGQTGGPTGNFGTGNTPPVSPSQGEPGGNPSGTATNSGAGGGFMEAGTAPRVGGAGGGFQGFGTSGENCGSYYYFGGGGGGAGQPSGNAQLGGIGGGGAGGYPAPTGPESSGTAGTANTGGGGGGGTFVDCSTGGGGGSGIVIIRYKYQN